MILSRMVFIYFWKFVAVWLVKCTAELASRCIGAIRQLIKREVVDVGIKQWGDVRLRSICKFFVQLVTTFSGRENENFTQ